MKFWWIWPPELIWDLWANDSFDYSGHLPSQDCTPSRPVDFGLDHECTLVLQSHVCDRRACREGGRCFLRP